VRERPGNAFSFWPDHTYGRIPWPTHEDMKRWGWASIWYFYTEDIYNPKLAEDWGYPNTASYSDAVVQFILDQGRALGKDRVFWSVGHENVPLPFHVEGETVWWRAYVPRFSLTVYRVKLP